MNQPLIDFRGSRTTISNGPLSTREEFIKWRLVRYQKRREQNRVNPVFIPVDFDISLESLLKSVSNASIQKKKLSTISIRTNTRQIKDSCFQKKKKKNKEDKHHLIPPSSLAIKHFPPQCTPHTKIHPSILP